MMLHQTKQLRIRSNRF